MSSASIFLRTSTLTRAALRTTTTATSPTTTITSARVQFPKINNFKYNNNTTIRTFRSSLPKMGVHNIDSKAAFDEALKNDVVILDAFATWCGPCKVIAPTVAKFSEEYPNAHFIKVDVDEVPDVAQELSIRAMPTFLIFKGGEKVGEVVGANPTALKAAIEKSLL